MDYIVRAMAAGDRIRAFACTTKELTEYARRVHNTTPVTTAALGRLMAGGLMMGTMLKGEDELITLRIQGEGPARGALVTANSKGEIKGYVNNPDVNIPLRPDGKLDVGNAFGAGILSVIKDLGLKEPYVGQTILQTGEVAEDLTYYFATSEQIPSCVGLGVLVDKDYSVKQAGGFIIQLMPFADEETIDKLEDNIKKISSVTSMLDSGMNPEQMLEAVLGDMDLTITDTIPAKFACNCSKERFTKGLVSIGTKELKEMIDDNKPINVNCHFCNANYEFTVEELKNILIMAKK
ncbi:MAG: Hsp33 family molecular chaperone HslO [Clostridiales bacterium]|nr:Hsp33 family molecular chaperone HslO [Clostridiales bacterium]